MRSVVLVVLALACPPAAADPVHPFAAHWPKLAASITPQLSRALFSGRPCGDDRPGPPVGDDAKASVAPDGKTLVVIADFDLDDAGATLFGIGGAEERNGSFAVVFDGPSGKWSARGLGMLWLPCSNNSVDWTWSKDNRRVLAGLDSGHGIRTAFLDVRARTLIATGFDNLVLPSPNLVHVAHTPWTAGRAVNPDQDDKSVYGALLWIDDHDVWGSSDPDAASVWAVEWKSDERLEFCGQKPKLAPARYRVTFGSSPVVTRIAGSCPAGAGASSE
jgi:hypothetical protein